MAFPFIQDPGSGQWYQISIVGGILVNSPVAGPTPAPPPPTSVTPSSPGGLSIDDIIEQANKRTERKGENRLDLKSEFLAVLQDFCLEHRWFWRRRTATFNTVIGQPSYDLTDSQGANAADLEQFCRRGVKIVDSATGFSCLEPIFDVETQDAAIEDSTQSKPGNYFIDPGSSLSLRLTPVPNAIYKVRLAYWAVPNPLVKAQGVTVPLVPGYLHPILVKGLEVAIFRYTLGEGAPKYASAKQEYDAMVARAAARRDFADGQVREWRDVDCEDSVRSTH